MLRNLYLVSVERSNPGFAWIDDSRNDVVVQYARNVSLFCWLGSPEREAANARRKDSGIRYEENIFWRYYITNSWF